MVYLLTYKSLGALYLTFDISYVAMAQGCDEHRLAENTYLPLVSSFGGETLPVDILMKDAND